MVIHPAQYAIHYTAILGDTMGCAGRVLDPLGRLLFCDMNDVLVF